MAGAEVYAELLERYRLSGFRYSPLGLRDGILAQMMADHATRAVKRIEDERWDSIRAALQHYRVDMDHALKVREAAVNLFAALKSVHRLPLEYQEWLSAAAMLYEVGDYVNRNGRHRHAYYIISHSEILGYTPQQRTNHSGVWRGIWASRALRQQTEPIKMLASSLTGCACARLPFSCAGPGHQSWAQ